MQVGVAEETVVMRIMGAAAHTISDHAAFGVACMHAVQQPMIFTACELPGSSLTHIKVQTA